MNELELKRKTYGSQPGPGQYEPKDTVGTNKVVKLNDPSFSFGGGGQRSSLGRNKN